MHTLKFLSVLEQFWKEAATKLDQTNVKRTERALEEGLAGCPSHSSGAVFKLRFSPLVLTWDMPQVATVLEVKQDEDGHLTNRNRDKAEVFIAFFALVFNTDDGTRGSQCPELEDHDCENDKLPVNPETVGDVLLQLDPY
ncbi:hypothetical protein WISP_103670 [Willisornis vidua]|uniref:Uncharacterized protein n=1 Tax=Willisornis vidua TaxID=1566151 RepID=A0ABQ9CXP1_9PASS|nr:hypothetical protein WISP_103670 [Willisornis vidua]